WTASVAPCHIFDPPLSTFTNTQTALNNASPTSSTPSKIRHCKWCRLPYLATAIGSRHEAFPGGGGILGPPHHGGPPGFDLELGSVGARIASAEHDYDIFVGRRNALIREMGTDPTIVEAWPALSAKFHMYTLWDFFLPAFRCPHKVKRIGINGESSFEAELLQSTKCEIWGYDYSVKEFGPEIENFLELKSRGHFHPYALGGKDDHGSGVNPPFYTLPTLMQMNDLIKAHKGKPLPFGQLQLEVHAWGKSFVEVLSFWREMEEIRKPVSDRSGRNLIWSI
ncbi:hypothetical protein FRB90_009788, partial [Tulasnella sp. 427]